MSNLEPLSHCAIALRNACIRESGRIDFVVTAKGMVMLRPPPLISDLQLGDTFLDDLCRSCYHVLATPEEIVKAWCEGCDGYVLRADAWVNPVALFQQALPGIPFIPVKGWRDAQPFITFLVAAARLGGKFKLTQSEATLRLGRHTLSARINALEWTNRRYRLALGVTPSAAARRFLSRPRLTTAGLGALSRFIHRTAPALVEHAKVIIAATRELGPAAEQVLLSEFDVQYVNGDEPVETGETLQSLMHFEQQLGRAA